MQTTTKPFHFSPSRPLGLSFANEQDAAFAAASLFTPLPAHRLKQIREQAREAVQGKGDCWWNPPPAPGSVGR